MNPIQSLENYYRDLPRLRPNRQASWIYPVSAVAAGAAVASLAVFIALHAPGISPQSGTPLMRSQYESAGLSSQDQPINSGRRAQRNGRWIV